MIPTYNEAHRLPATLQAIRPYLDARFAAYEVIVVDDNSPDGTQDIVEAARADWPNLRLVRQPGKVGKGAAVRRGCLAATSDVVMFMDADLATPIEELDLLLQHAPPREHWAVVGVRTYQEDEAKWRRVIGLSLQLIAHLIVFEKAVVDSQCGFKCFSRATCRELFRRSRVNGGMFDIELFSIMHRLRIPIYYQPVHWANKAGSRINILRCILFDPLDLIAIRLRWIFGIYGPEGLPATKDLSYDQPIKR